MFSRRCAPCSSEAPAPSSSSIPSSLSTWLCPRGRRVRSGGLVVDYPWSERSKKLFVLAQTRGGADVDGRAAAEGGGGKSKAKAREASAGGEGGGGDGDLALGNDTALAFGSR